MLFKDFMRGYAVWFMSQRDDSGFFVEKVRVEEVRVEAGGQDKAIKIVQGGLQVMAAWRGQAVPPAGNNDKHWPDY